MEKFWQWLGHGSDILSLFSAAIGLFAFLKIRKIEFHLARRELISPRREDLKTHAGDILAELGRQTSALTCQDLMHFQIRP